MTLRLGKYIEDSYYEVCSKSIETEAVFAKTKMYNQWNINFLQNILLGIHKKLFQWVFYWLKHLWIFFFGIVWSSLFNFLLMTSMFSNFLLLKWIFSLGNKKKSFKVKESSLYGGRCICTILCFPKNILFEKLFFFLFQISTDSTRQYSII